MIHIYHQVSDLKCLNVKISSLLLNLYSTGHFLKGLNFFELACEIVDVIRRFNYVLRVFHVGKIDIPPDLHEIHIERLHLGWHHSEVDQLEERPNLPICYHGRHKLLFQLVFGALKIFAFQRAYKEVKAGDGSKRKCGLGEK